MRLRQWLIGLPTSLFEGFRRNTHRTSLKVGVISRASIGRRGESIARQYLRKKGWRLIASNVRLGHDELDILALCSRARVLAIVEVRATNNPNKRPELTISKQKRIKMLRVARQFQRLAIKYHCQLRVDVIAVQLAHESPKVDHYEGIFPIEHARNLF